MIGSSNKTRRYSRRLPIIRRTSSSSSRVQWCLRHRELKCSNNQLIKWEGRKHPWWNLSGKMPRRWLNQQLEPIAISEKFIPCIKICFWQISNKKLRKLKQILRAANKNKTQLKEIWWISSVKMLNSEPRLKDTGKCCKTWRLRKKVVAQLTCLTTWDIKECNRQQAWDREAIYHN